MNSKPSIAERLWLLVFGVAALIVSVIISGIVVVQLWGWFVVAPFDAPQLTLPTAIGLSWLIGYFKPVPKLDEEDRLLIQQHPWQAMLKAAFKSIFRAAITLLFASYLYWQWIAR